MVPIAFCAIGPVGVYVSDLLVKLVLLLKDLGPVGNGIMAALLPAVVILGLSGADITAMLILVSSGSDPILFFANVIFNSVLGFVVLARYVKHKDAKLLAMAITATIGGTSEPAVFGLGVNDITVLLSTSLGAFVGGFISRLFGVKTFSIASFGILGTVATLGEDSSFLGAIVAIITGCTVGFIASILTERK